jgi:hypothetical protein
MTIQPYRSEMQVIVATNDNKGQPMVDAHDLLERDLIAVAGGVTTLAGKGSWTTPDGVVQSEPATIYIVAVEQGVQSYRVLERVKEFLNVTDQHSAYVRMPSGRVTFVERHEALDFRGAVL